MAFTGCNRHENSVWLTRYFQLARLVIASDAETLRYKYFLQVTHGFFSTSPQYWRSDWKTLALRTDFQLQVRHLFLWYFASRRIHKVLMCKIQGTSTPPAHAACQLHLRQWLHSVSGSGRPHNVQTSLSYRSKMTRSSSGLCTVKGSRNCCPSNSIWCRVILERSYSAR